MKNPKFFLSLLLVLLLIISSCNKTDKSQTDKKPEVETTQKTEPPKKTKTDYQQEALDNIEKRKQQKIKDFIGTWVKKTDDGKTLMKFVANSDYTYSLYFDGIGVIADGKEVDKVYNFKGKWEYQDDRVGFPIVYKYNGKDYVIENLDEYVINVKFLGQNWQCRNVKK